MARGGHWRIVPVPIWMWTNRCSIQPSHTHFGCTPQTFVRTSGIDVDHDQWLGTDLSAHGNVLVGTNRVYISVIPHCFRSDPALRLRPNPVFPLIRADERPPGPANDRWPQVGDRLQEVRTKATAGPPRLRHDAHLIQPDFACAAHADLQRRILGDDTRLELEWKLSPLV